MTKDVKTLFIAIIISLFFINFVSAQIISSDVEKEVDSGKEVPVIITYKSDLKISAYGSVNKDWEARTVNENELEKLVSYGNIERIEYDYPLTLTLQDSRRIVNSSYTAQRAFRGVNMSGGKIGVCILDTGINYSHSDFGSCTASQILSGTCDKIPLAHDFGSGDTDVYDYSGHGTHVAGIVGASGVIEGIAGNVSLIIGKVFDDSGSGSTSNLISAINWCVGNSTNFNISVISMSINLQNSSGSLLLNNSYCDNEHTSLAAAVDSAYLKNISVVVSSGNNGNRTAVGVPSCFRNVTAVGSLNKNDAFSSFSNRNNISVIVAPGENINSTGKPHNSGCTSVGNYMICSGTSMSAPHVSAVIALMWQYLKANGETKTPNQIKEILNNTGLRVTDSTNVNYSRINAYQALLTLDTHNPNVSLAYPINATVNTSNNQTFICNSTDFSLTQVRFWLWNATNNLINQTNRTVSGSSISSEFNVSNLASGVYKWNCQYLDESNNLAFSSSNFTVSVAGPNIVLSTPSNASRVNNNHTYVCNATHETGLLNVSYYLWNSTGSQIATYNKTVTGTSNSSNFQVNFTHEGNHEWNCRYTDVNGVSIFASSNNSIFYDVTRPGLTVVSPINASNHSVGRFNATLSENGTCMYSLNSGVNNFTMSATDNMTFNATNTTLVHNANYTVRYYCNDTAGNTNLTSFAVFTADTDSPSVTVDEPNDNAEYTGDDTKITFTYDVEEDRTILNCKLYLNNAVESTNTSITNLGITQSITRTLDSGDYDWFIRCTDKAGNEADSETRSFEIIEASSSGSSGGGSGGGGTGSTGGTTTGTQTTTTNTGQIYNIEEENLKNGETKVVKEKDKILFFVSENTHSISIKDVASNFVKIVVASEPQEFTLELNDTVKVNLTSPDKYDISITLVSIAGSQAIIKVQSINEEIPEEVRNANSANSQSFKGLVWGVVGFIVLVIGVALVMAHRQGQLGRKVIIKNIKQKLTGK